MNRLERLILFLLVFLLTAAYTCIGAPRSRNVIRDDFETHSNWTFTCRGTGGQEFSKEVVHAGKRALNGITSRFELIHHREVPRYVDSHSRISFWCYGDYEPGDAFWTRLIVGVTRAGEKDPLLMSLRAPEARRWEPRELLIEEISPGLAGAPITSIHIGLRGRGTILRLALDDVLLENDSPGSFWKARADAVPPPRFSQASAFSWAADKVRGVYVTPPPSAASAYREIFQSPINTFFLGELDPQIVVEWANRSASYGKHLFLVVPAFPPMESLTDEKSFRRARFADTIEDNVVCPRDTVYWEKGLGALLQSLADLADLAHIEGCLLDLRLPSDKHPKFSSVDACLCDDCFDAFLEDKKSQERSSFIPLYERRNFLVSKGWLDDYAVWEESVLIDVGRNVARQLRKKHANIALGIFSFENFWLARGLAIGFASDSTPTLVVASEPARTDGYNLAVREMTNSLRQFGGPALFVPGLDPDRLAVAKSNLQEHLFRTLLGADGFWITLPPPNDQEGIKKIGTTVREAFARYNEARSKG